MNYQGVFHSVKNNENSDDYQKLQRPQSKHHVMRNNKENIPVQKPSSKRYSDYSTAV